MQGSSEGAWGGKEIGGRSRPCHIGVTRGIDCYAPLPGAVNVVVLLPASAQIGGVDQSRAGRIKLADKGVATPAVTRLERARGSREIGRGCAARHISVARS